MSVSRINRARKMADSDNEAVVEDLVQELEKKFQYGTSAPDANTPGNIYFKIGSATTDAVTVFIKDGSTWYGG
ncbi:MAG: hypothetical protein WC648_05010 [Candidatus Paceibacterota bacterium]|jgi:hypothetical protein